MRAWGEGGFPDTVWVGGWQTGEGGGGVRERKGFSTKGIIYY